MGSDAVIGQSSCTRRWLSWEIFSSSLDPLPSAKLISQDWWLQEETEDSKRPNFGQKCRRRFIAACPPSQTSSMTPHLICSRIALLPATKESAISWREESGLFGPRHHHACGLVRNAGSQMIIVTGGFQ